MGRLCLNQWGKYAKHLEAFTFPQKSFICTAHYVETTGKVIYLSSYEVLKPYQKKKSIVLSAEIP